MMSFKHVSFLILALFVTSCFKPTQRASNLTKENSATFYLEEVTSEGQIIDTGEWKFPNAKNYNFKVCIKDQNTQDKIAGHQFLILDANGNLLDKRRSSADGCLNWNETIKYNYVADAKYLPLTRFLRADGMHSGQRKISLAINPWKDRTKSSVEKEVVDLNFKKLDPSQIVNESEVQLSLAGLSQQRRLWIDGMIIGMSNLGAAGALSKNNAVLKVDMVPHMLLKDATGSIVSTPITNGRFMVQAFLVAVVKEGTTKNRVILGESNTEKPLQMVGERFRADLPLTQTWKSAMGQLELVLKVTPIDGPEGLAPFEGVFMIGSYKTLGGFVGVTPENNNPRLDSTFSIAEYLRDSIRPDESNPVSGIFPLAPFEFSYFQFRLSNVDVGHETPTRRKMHILIETTVKNPLENGEIVRSTVFTIRKVNGQSENKTTNQDGILAWDDVLDFKTFAPPRYINRTITISHKNGFTQTFTLKINPWAKLGFALGVDQRNSDFPIGIDLRNPDGLSKVERFEKLNLLLKPQLLMGKYVFAINENTEYKIDKSLTQITPYKSFIINLAPYLLTYSNPLDGIESASGLRDGYYLLKVGLEANIFGRRHISTLKKIVILRNGQINEPIRMRVDDVRQMKIRNLVYVEFHPIDYSKLTFTQGFLKGYNIKNLDRKKLPTNLDELIDIESGYEPRTFVGIFSPTVNKGEGPLRPTDDMDELFTDQTADNTDEDEEIVNANEVEKSKVFDDLIPLDDRNLNYRNDPRIKALLNDPKFREDLKINSSKNINEFLLRMRVEGYTPTTVKDLEQEEIKLLSEYKADAKSRAKLDKFAEFANTEFITLNNENEIVNNFYPNLKKLNSTLGSSGSKNNFIKLLNSANTILGEYNNLYQNKKYHVTEQEIRSLLPKVEQTNIVKSPGLSKDFAARLCNFWFNHYLDNKVLDNSYGALFTACIKHIMEKDGTSNNSSESVFLLDQKIRVFNKVRHAFVRGYVLRLGVNSSFRVSYGYGVGESNNLSMAWSFAPVGTLFPYKAIHFLSNIAAGFGSTFHSDSRAYDAGYGKSSDVGAGTSLSGEEAHFKLGINEFERCSIIRLNPDYIARAKLLERVKINANAFVKSNLLTKGIMICSGELEKAPIILPETMFFFTPDPGDSNALLVSTDIKNYEWAVSFRGRKDYTAFIKLIKSKGLQLEESSILIPDLRKIVAKSLKLDVDVNPTDHLSPSVQDVQKPAAGFVTTYPGVYTVP
ncbi:MAG: hypothetical protein IPM57_05440 [Oligoflexia bacterium]|nr:hypothetical protein [Oligoflexia bacterium]